MPGEELKELDRDMETVFDSICVLNSAMTAIVESLAPNAADHVMQRLDAALDDVDTLNSQTRKTLLGWRNMAARQAGSDAKHDPA